MGKKVSFLDCYVAPIREKERESGDGGREWEREKDRILVILRPSSAQNVSSI